MLDRNHNTTSEILKSHGITKSAQDLHRHRDRTIASWYPEHLAPVAERAEKLNEAGVPLKFEPDVAQLLIRSMRTVAEGQPVNGDQVAAMIAEVGIDEAKAEEFLRTVTERNDDDNIIGIVGLSQNPIVEEISDFRPFPGTPDRCYERDIIHTYQGAVTISVRDEQKRVYQFNFLFGEDPSQIPDPERIEM